jgi:hypothetical protein
VASKTERRERNVGNEIEDINPSLRQIDRAGEESKQIAGEMLGSGGPKAETLQNET